MCSRHAEYGAGYDITDLQADGAQEAHPLWQWTALCGRSHEFTNDYGIGLVERDDPDGATLRECDRCLELREDWEQGRGERVA